MKKKQLVCTALACTFALSAFLLSSCGKKPPEEEGGGDAEWNNKEIWLSADPLVPTSAVVLPQSGERTANVSVHDPSVFWDSLDSKYYAFGTHFAFASSDNLIIWRQLASDNQPNVLYGEERCAAPYGSFPKAIEETVNLVQPVTGAGAITTTWAPDVEFIGGKYYMYYSLTYAFGSNKSAIARVESDYAYGPYTNNTILVESVTSTEADKPNCIDPELFYDKDGRLWMVYGSFFGGIYIKELYTEGERVGLPKEEGFGKLLWQNGYSTGVEGPFIFYNATTEYYYLMVSEGDLTTVYNMRVARSKNPDGPYTDVTGADVAATGKGNKIAGNYKFARAGTAQGYAAMGHNSVIKDGEGRYFVVYHTRRQTGTEVTAGHNLYTNQLYFNEEGWPVMAPAAYVGESAGTVTAEQVASTYEVVIHNPATVVAMAESQDYVLAQDGTVTRGGTPAGSWTLSQNFYITVTIDNVAYKGVVVPVWDMYAPSNGGVLAITATSDAGVSLWALAK